MPHDGSGSRKTRRYGPGEPSAGARVLNLDLATAEPCAKMEIELGSCKRGTTYCRPARRSEMAIRSKRGGPERKEVI